MSSESGILADHLNEDNLNDDQITEDDPKQNSSSPELLLEAIRRIGRDKLRNIMLDLSFGSKSAQTLHFRTNFGPFLFITGQLRIIYGLFSSKTVNNGTKPDRLVQNLPFFEDYGPKPAFFDPRKVCNLQRAT